MASVSNAVSNDENGRMILSEIPSKPLDLKFSPAVFGWVRESRKWGTYECAICKTKRWEFVNLTEDVSCGHPGFKAIGAYHSPPIRFPNGTWRAIAVHNVCAILAIKCNFVETFSREGQDLKFRVIEKLNDEGRITFRQSASNDLNYHCIIEQMRSNQLDSELAGNAEIIKQYNLNARQVAGHLRDQPNNFKEFKAMIKLMSDQYKILSKFVTTQSDAETDSKNDK